MNMTFNNFKLDYLSFTFRKSGEHVNEEFQELFSSLFDPGVFNLKFPRSKRQYYQFVVSFSEYFYIRYDEEDRGKGVNVEIPSHGLEIFFDRMGWKSVKECFMWLNNHDCTPSRIYACYCIFIWVDS